MIQTINATSARQNFFDLLIAARDKKQVTKVKLNGVVVANIVPEEEKKFDWESYIKRADRAAKYLSKFDWSDVLENRKNMWKLRRYKGW